MLEKTGELEEGEEEEEKELVSKKEKPIGPIFNPWINYLSPEETKKIKEK